MRTTLRSLAAAIGSVSVLASAALSASPAPTGPPADPGGPLQGPVYVDSTDILYLESFPVQVHLAVSGSLPTPCHEPAWTVEQAAAGIAVRLWSEAETAVVCASVLEPLEVSIPVGSFEEADLPVTLNGELVGRVIVGEPITVPSGATEMLGAGWSFGICQGNCAADLVIDGDDLVLVGRDHEEGTPLFEHRGRLTTKGRAALDAALEALGETVLDATYGCPDCADGGASYLVLARDGDVTRHEMEHSAPPAELAALDALAASLIDALKACEADELVSVEEGCVARQE